MLCDYSYRQTHRMCNNYCFCTATIVRQTHLRFTLYVHCLLCFVCVCVFLCVCVCVYVCVYVCVCVRVCGKSVYHFAVASCMAVQSFDVGCELLQAMPPPTPTNCIFICHMYSGDCRAPNYIVQVNLKHKLYQCGKRECPLWAAFLNFECLSLFLLHEIHHFIPKLLFVCMDWLSCRFIVHIVIKIFLLPQTQLLDVLTRGSPLPQSRLNRFHTEFSGWFEVYIGNMILFVVPY